MRALNDLEGAWERARPVKRMGRSNFRISRDASLFFKRQADRPDLMRHEYEALCSLTGETGVEGLRTLEAVGLVGGDTILVTRLCPGRVLADICDPVVYRAFGRRLRALHASGATHGHLTPDDVLVQGDGFVLTDLALWGRLPPHRDVVDIRLNMRIRTVRRPWLARSLHRRWRAFTEGYGLCWGGDHQTDIEKLVGRRSWPSKRHLRGLAMAVCRPYLTARPHPCNSERRDP